MRKLIVILVILLSLKGFSQNPVLNFPYLGNPTTNTYIRGWESVDSGFAYKNIFRDTLINPFAVGEFRIRNQDSSLYVSVSTSAALKWRRVAGGGGSGSGFNNGGNSFAGNASIGLNDNFYLDFKTNNISRMRMFGTGNFYINGTADDGSKFRINGSVRLDLGNDQPKDFHYRDVDGNLKRLAVGQIGQHLIIDGSGNYKWVDSSAILSNNFIRYKTIIDSTDGGPIAGDSAFKITTSLTGKFVKLYIDGIQQRDSVTWGTGTGFEVATNDTIKVHPPFVGGEVVTVEIYPYSDWAFVVPAGYDADAQAYFNSITTAGGSLTTSVKNAINAFTIGLKADNLWALFDYIHILSNGSEIACKFNLKDPQNTDASYRLTFTNSATFASTGVTTNGTNQYINTHFIMSTAPQAGTNDYCISVFNRTTAGVAGFTFGVSDGPAPYYMLCRSTDDKTYSRGINNGETNFSDATTGKGFYIMNDRPSVAPVWQVVKDGVQKSVASHTFGNSATATYPLLYNAYNNIGSIVNFRAGELCFISGGASMTDAQLANFNTRVQTLKTALGW